VVLADCGPGEDCDVEEAGVIPVADVFDMQRKKKKRSRK
jgi:hypothetical protein